jgi:hypothetical protein
VTTTDTARSTANPRRTTLAHLENADDFTAEAMEYTGEIPAATANPRRTVLNELPGGAAG